eukprot:403348517
MQINNKQQNRKEDSKYASINLNSQQKEAVEYFGAPLLILAEELALGKLKLLSLTFSKKAAKEMIQRAEILSKVSMKNSYIGTFHAISARILSHLDTLNSFMRSKFSYLELHIFSKIYPLYQQLLQQRNQCDYQYLLFYVWKFLRSQQQPASTILREVRKEFQYIFVDEVQDLNKLQQEWLKLIVGDNKNLTCVGDNDQMIYGFRGADGDFILKFEEHFETSKRFEIQLAFKFLLFSINPYDDNNTKEILATLQVSKATLSVLTHFQKSCQNSNPKISFYEVCIDIINETNKNQQNPLILEINDSDEEVKTIDADKTETTTEKLKRQPIFSKAQIKDIQNIFQERKNLSKCKDWKRIELYLKNSGFYSYVEVLSNKKNKDFKKVEDNIKELLKKINHETSVIILVNEMKQEYARLQKTITLLNFHQSKGLEFDYVYLPFWNTGDFTKYNQSEEEIEEERRVGCIDIINETNKNQQNPLILEINDSDEEVKTIDADKTETTTEKLKRQPIFSKAQIKDIQNIFQERKNLSKCKDWKRIELYLKNSGFYSYVEVLSNKKNKDFKKVEDNIKELLKKINHETSVIILVNEMKQEYARLQKTITLLNFHQSKGLEFDYVYLPFWNTGDFTKYNQSEEEIEEERRVGFI